MLARRRVLFNYNGFSYFELVFVIAILTVVTAILTPYVLGLVKNAQKTADVGNAKELAKTTIGVFNTLDNKYSYVGKIDFTDEEMHEIEEAIIGQVKEIPKIQTYKGRYFIIYIEEDGNIIVKDSDDAVLYPDVDEAYRKE